MDHFRLELNYIQKENHVLCKCYETWKRDTVALLKWYWFIAFCADKSIKWNGYARSKI